MPANFNRVARLYHLAETLSLGPLLQRARTHFLPELTTCRQAYLLGDGDGRFLAQLLHANPDIQAVAVDTSSSMLHLLRQNCAFAANRVHTHHVSALHSTPPPTTDLIVTHFFLDCLTQLQLDALAQDLSDALPTGTLWLLSDFAIPTNPLLRPLAALYIRSLYLAFRILTGLRITRLPNPQESLAYAGFTLLARHSTLGGLIYTELWQLQ